MIRTQIQLDPAQARRLKEVAQRERVSVAEVVRRCIDRALAETGEDLDARYARAGRLIGRLAAAGAPGDLAERHDAYLAETLD